MEKLNEILRQMENDLDRSYNDYNWNKTPDDVRNHYAQFIHQWHINKVKELVGEEKEIYEVVVDSAIEDEDGLQILSKSELIKENVGSNDLRSSILNKLEVEDE